MSKVHVVTSGDHVPRLGAAEGFADVGIIWNHPRNAELTAIRDNFCILNPGDQIFIPDKQPKAVTASTGKTHTLVVLRPKIRLSMVVKDVANQPLANVPCELRTETASFPLVLDKNGQFDQEIPVDSESCRLVFSTREIHVLVGHLAPIDVPDGQRARLNNLGYEARALEHDEEPERTPSEVEPPEVIDATAESEAERSDRAFRSALEEFQCDHEVAVTGVFDAATRAKLLEVHGC